MKKPVLIGIVGALIIAICLLVLFLYPSEPEQINVNQEEIEKLNAELEKMKLEAETLKTQVCEEIETTSVKNTVIPSNPNTSKESTTTTTKTTNPKPQEVKVESKSESKSTNEEKDPEKPEESAIEIKLPIVGSVKIGG